MKQRRGIRVKAMRDKDIQLTRRGVLLAGTGAFGLAALASQATTAFAHNSEQSAISGMQGTDQEWKAVASVFNVEGTIVPGGVLLIELPRIDLHPTVFGVAVKPAIGFVTQIAFQHIAEQTIVKYQMVLLDSEVNPVLTALFAQNLQPRTTNFNALQNHFLELQPQVKFLHGTTIGDAVTIAKALRTALSQSKQPFQSSSPGTTGLANQQIASIIGGMEKISDSVLSVAVARNETICELGHVLKPTMQVSSMFNFQAIANGRAAVHGECILLPSEVDAVARTLRKHSFEVMAVHNHELFIRPLFYYLHSFSTGEPLTLAQYIRDALNQTNSRFV